MTHVKFFRRGGFYYGFEETGHTGFGESGDDILCSALSAMTMLIINTIEISYAQEVDYEVDEGATRISVKCMAALPDYSADEKAQVANPHPSPSVKTAIVSRLSLRISFVLSRKQLHR